MLGDAFLFLVFIEYVSSIVNARSKEMLRQRKL